MSNVQPNVNGSALSIPDVVRQATVPPIRVESQKLADGVWYLGGGSHNSVAVEFRDFVAIVEAPLNQQRSLAVIEEVKKMVPNKPIRYVVNTHHHFDHLGGLRTYVAEGAIIITHYLNREFYEHTVFGLRPWTLLRDRLSLYPIEATIETVTAKYLLSDGVRTMEVHPVRDFDHAATMLIAYLPKEKIVVEADLYNPPPPGAPPQTTPTPANESFYENVRRLKLDITQVVPIHGRVIPMADFLKVVGKEGAN